jgi:hypothetical protein
MSYRLVRGGADDDHVLYACRRGLSLALKRGGGFPSLHGRAGLVASVGAGTNASEAVSSSRALVITEGGTRHAQLAHRSLQRVLARVDLPTSIEEAEYTLAESLCREVLDHLLFSKLGVECQTLGKTTDEFEAYRNRLLSGLQEPIASFAAQLVADPSGASVQAPALRRPPRSSTAVLLAEVVG